MKMTTHYIVKKELGIVISVIKVEDYCVHISFSGKSKLNPMDEWNEERGKRLANLRAHVKYHQWQKNREKQILKENDSYFLAVKGRVFRHEQIINSLKKQIEKQDY